MKKKKFILIIAAALLICSGCANSQQSDTSSPSSVPPVAEGSITPKETSEASEKSQADEQSEYTHDQSSEQTSVTKTQESISEISSDIRQTEISEGLTKQELEDMQKVSNAMSERFEQDDYKNATPAERKKIALELLNKLAGQGLIIRESIYADDEMVSFSYSCGVLGGVQLREWDPMMN